MTQISKRFFFFGFFPFASIVPSPPTPHFLPPEFPFKSILKFQENPTNIRREIFFQLNIDEHQRRNGFHVETIFDGMSRGEKICCEEGED
jgi:hypothetical protein